MSDGGGGGTCLSKFRRGCEMGGVKVPLLLRPRACKSSLLRAREKELNIEKRRAVGTTYAHPFGVEISTNNLSYLHTINKIEERHKGAGSGVWGEEKNEYSDAGWQEEEMRRRA